MSKNRDEHNKHQQEIFAREVGDYCTEIPEEIRQRLKRIVEVAELTEGERVLDVGTGTGVLIPYFRESGVNEIVGCDLSSTMLEKAQQQFPDVTFWCGDIVDLPATLGTFDAVFFNAMFGNVWNQKETLSTAVKLLRDRGRICISHPLGSRYVAGLNQRDPLRTPHPLPGKKRLGELVQQLPLQVIHVEDELDFYVAILHKI